MDNIISFKKPRNKTIKGHSRECYAEATEAVGKLKAVAIVALGIDGRFAIRSAFDEEKIGCFDVYARVSALAGRECSKLMVSDE